VNRVRTHKVARRRLTRLLVGPIAGALLVVGLIAGNPGGRAYADTAPADPNDPTTPLTVSNDALPTPQINGVAWATAMANDTVYVGGSFTSARPDGAAAGQNTVPRSNLLAFNVTTGQLLSFNPNPAFNGQILAMSVSPDKTRLYVGGEFTTVNGQPRSRIAAFNINSVSGSLSLVSTFAPPVNYNVRAVTATNNTVYAGGDFLSVGNAPRAFLAAFTANNGALLDWAPQATGGGGVAAILVNPQGTKVAVGGSFTALNGSSNPGYGLGMVDAVTGASLPMPINTIVRNGTTDGAIDNFTTDGTYVYGSGWTFGRSGGTMEGVFAASWDGGETRFINDCHGDTYDVEVIGKVVYTAGHTHYCENLDGVRQGAGGVGDYPYYRSIATTTQPTRTLTWEPDQGRYFNFYGQPAPEFLGWYPSLNAGTFTGQFQGPWTVTGNSDYVVLAGEFTRVNNRNQQGITRFTIREKAANTSGPKLFNTTYPLNVSSTEAGSVRINWMANNDDDNEYLTYRLYRDSVSGTNLKQTVTKRFRRWESVTMGFTDTGLAPGSTHQYRVVVTDPFGNTANSPWTTVTVASSGVDSNYVKAVYDSQPTNYWRLGEAAGTTVSNDRVGFMPSTAAGGVIRGAAGAIAGDVDTASTFNGTNTGWMASSPQHNPPDIFSLEAWFKTTTVTGGRIVGWSNRNTQGSSSRHDRQIYMDNLGRVHFGTRPTNLRLVVSSTNSYNDGAWHHAVGSLSSAGLKLYVDGVEVASRSDVTAAEHLSLGYWRIGGDTVNGWPSAPSSGYFNGNIDEVAVYKHVLTPTEVAAHYSAGSGAGAPNIKPVAAFTANPDGLKVAVNGSTSTDADGTVDAYAWDFGDGGTATGVSASHDYTQAGTYTVTLTVTDDDGATGTATKQVKVTTPPTAAFTETITGQSVSFDGSTSTDAEGPIANYAWDFGDQETGTGPTPTHEYAAGGTYEVTLTVTDGDGATDSVTRPITIVAENKAPVAQFTTSTNGLTLGADGSGSTDSDGTIETYAWDFGDNADGSGATVTHLYAAGGSYDVTLTVTDNDGATHTLTKQVTVSAAAPPFAADAFGRTVSNSWGNADIGGAWTPSTGTNLSVTGGRGTMRMATAGSGPSVALTTATSTDTEMRSTIGIDKVATGSGVYVTLRSRITTGGEYQAVVRYLSNNGSVSLKLVRRVGSTDTTLVSDQTVTGLTVAPGDRLNVKVQAYGTSPTTLRAKVWAVGTAEPTNWIASVTDSTSGLQAVGGIGFSAYLSSTATNAPVIASFDDLWAGPHP
jgi:PKD repeat protein